MSCIFQAARDRQCKIINAAFQEASISLDPPQCPFAYMYQQEAHKECTIYQTVRQEQNNEQ